MFSERTTHTVVCHLCWDYRMYIQKSQLWLRCAICVEITLCIFRRARYLKLIYFFWVLCSVCLFCVVSFWTGFRLCDLSSCMCDCGSLTQAYFVVCCMLFVCFVCFFWRGSFLCFFSLQVRVWSVARSPEEIALQVLRECMCVERGRQGEGERKRKTANERDRRKRLCCSWRPVWNCVCVCGERERVREGGRERGREKESERQELRYRYERVCVYVERERQSVRERLKALALDCLDDLTGLCWRPNWIVLTT